MQTKFLTTSLCNNMPSWGTLIYPAHPLIHEAIDCTFCDSSGHFINFAIDSITSHFIFCIISRVFSLSFLCLVLSGYEIVYSMNHPSTMMLKFLYLHVQLSMMATCCAESNFSDAQLYAIRQLGRPDLSLKKEQSLSNDVINPEQPTKCLNASKPQETQLFKVCN